MSTKARREEIQSVPSYPAKSFFVSMLTRDIELQDAILDLLDNCVDGAIRTRDENLAEKDSLKGFWAHIKFDESKFTIEDNCGGIPWNLARDYAFRMGRPEGKRTKAGTIGVVGIGMKRAIFKMGRECYVHSHHADDVFMVSVPREWFENDEWGDFQAEREKPVSRAYGTILEITELTDVAKLAFRSGSTFRTTFPHMVAESYSYLIEKGFKVTINDELVKRRPVKLCFESLDSPKKKGQLLRPFIYEGVIDGVEVFFAVGYRSRLLTQEEQESDAESTFAARESGWNVVCNDRVVLSNDRTIKTGWGFGGVPSFHNQFSCIAGIVEYKARDSAKLPITTTKRGIDTSKEIYELVRARMQEGLKHFTKNTNRWKGSEGELKERFDELQWLDLRELRRVTGKLPLVNLRGNGVQHQYKPLLPERKKLETTRRICFQKELSDIETVSEYLFDEIRKPEEVGDACFDRILDEASK